MFLHSPGADKLKNSFLRETVLGVMAGTYIAFGFSLCMLCAGQVRPEVLVKFHPGRDGVFDNCLLTGSLKATNGHRFS